MRQPTAYEQLLVELVNRARLDPLAEAARFGISLNQGVGGSGISPEAKQPLAVNLRLNQAAFDHSQWMLQADVFSHTGAGGSSVGQRVTAAGYTWNYVGENISWVGTTGSLGDLSRVIEQQHENLFRSAGHRVNMLREAYAEMGAGQASGVFTTSRDWNASMLTEVFARPADGSRFLTGVVIDDRDGDDFYDVGEGLGGVTVTATGSAGTFTTTTWNAGGYSLAVPNGTYTVTFSGGALDGVVTVSAVMQGQNVKIDAEQDDAAPAIPAPGIVGTAAGERIDGTAGADVIAGEGGDDLIVADLGNDVVMAGGGNDTVLGNEGDDHLMGEAGADVLKGGDGDDRIEGGDGDDDVFGWRGADSISGGAGDDVLRGDFDEDRIEGGAGLDRITGGPGRDTFVFRAGFDEDRLLDYNPVLEKLDFAAHAGVSGFADLVIGETAGSTVILDGSGGRLVLVDVLMAEVTEGDFLFA